MRLWHVLVICIIAGIWINWDNAMFDPVRRRLQQMGAPAFLTQVAQPQLAPQKAN